MRADWEVAPKDATHYFDGDRLYAAHWMKHGFYCVTGFENDGWREDHQPLPLSRCEERPKRPQAWSGPEDGLPPVGTRCKVNPSNYGWREAEISYVGNQFIAWLQIGDEEVSENGGWTEFTKFAPIQTPEQLRESAIRELMDIAQVDCRVTAARLVDAGFKREVV